MNSHIEIHANIRHGTPVIRGTRVPVARVLGELSAGTSPEKIAAEYDISPDDVRAAIDFARELVEEQSFHLVPAE